MVTRFLGVKTPNHFARFILWCDVSFANRSESVPFVPFESRMV